MPLREIQRTWRTEAEAYVDLGDRNFVLLPEFHFHLHPLLQKCSAPAKIQKVVPGSQTGTTAKSFMQITNSMLFQVTQLKLYSKTTSECEENNIILLSAFLWNTSQNSAQRHYREESQDWLFFVLAPCTYGARNSWAFFPELSSHSQDRASISLISKGKNINNPTDAFEPLHNVSLPHNEVSIV